MSPSKEGGINNDDAEDEDANFGNDEDGNGITENFENFNYLVIST